MEVRVFALQWTDLNFTKRKILVERVFSDGELGTTKTEGVRNVDMSQELAVAITGLTESGKPRQSSRDQGQ